MRAKAIWQAVVGLVVLSELTSCSSPTSVSDEGQVDVSISAMTSGASITAVTVEAQPANITRSLTYNPSDGTFTGTLMLPGGDQTLTGRAYAGATLVGVGTVTVTVAVGSTVSAHLSILDTSADPPTPDGSPVITWLVASPSSALVGQTVTLSVAAADPDGDPLTYSWSDDCTTTTFGTPTAAQTTWSNSATGVCTVTVTVTAKGKSVSSKVDIATLASGNGTVSVQGTYTSKPGFYQVDANGQGFSCRMESYYTDSTCPQLASQGQKLNVMGHYWLGSSTTSFSTSLTDNCGGTTGTSWNGSGYTNYQWTAPQTRTACVLTFSVTQETMVTSFSFAIGVTGCGNDDFEQNDTALTAANLGTFTARAIGNLDADDDDWYSYDFSTSLSTLSVQAASSVGDNLPLELYDGQTLLVSGSNSLTYAVQPNVVKRFTLHVAPGAGAATCNSPYALSIQGQ